MPPDPKGGASAYVRDTGCCVFPNKSTVARIPIPPQTAAAAKKNVPMTTSKKAESGIVTFVNKHQQQQDIDDESGISPPPPYTTIYPPSPPSSAPSSPATGPISTSTIPSAAPLTPPTPPSVLSTVFPESSPVHSMPSKAVDLTDLVPTWKGALLEDASNAGQKTLYVVGGHFNEVNLRDTVCGVLEKAEDELGADAVVMVLEKNQAELSDLLHSLMYVGGTIVSQAQDQLSPNPAYLLVGLDV